MAPRDLNPPYLPAVPRTRPGLIRRIAHFRCGLLAPLIQDLIVVDLRTKRCLFQTANSLLSFLRTGAFRSFT
jgi:hypothetical protein